ncbi:MAG: hypothetical protein OJF52_001279 [Nitrospira sp.]|nr:MAG: hypothetical protein OJF52_001279 [Nitrospira sp.]
MHCVEKKPASGTADQHPIEEESEGFSDLVGDPGSDGVQVRNPPSQRRAMLVWGIQVIHADPSWLERPRI